MTKTALVTGASAGLGLQFARLFARDNVSLVLVARREDRLRQLKSELEASFGVQVGIIALDLAQPDSAARVLEFLDRQHIDVEFLVNNAGFGQSGSVCDIPLERTLGEIDLNVRALTE